MAALRRGERRTVLAVTAAVCSRGRLVRPAVIVVLLLLVLFAIPGIVSLYYVDAGTQVAIYAIVALGLNVLVGSGRAGLARPGCGARDRRLGGGQAAVRDLAAVRGRAADLGADHDGAGWARRSAGAADERHVPGADHVDAGRRDHGRARDDQLPQRRPRLLRIQRQPHPSASDPPPGHRGSRTRPSTATR